MILSTYTVRWVLSYSARQWGNCCCLTRAAFVSSLDSKRRMMWERLQVIGWESWSRSIALAASGTGMCPRFFLYDSLKLQHSGKVWVFSDLYFNCSQKPRLRFVNGWEQMVDVGNYSLPFPCSYIIRPSLQFMEELMQGWKYCSRCVPTPQTLLGLLLGLWFWFECEVSSPWCHSYRRIALWQRKF